MAGPPPVVYAIPIIAIIAGATIVIGVAYFIYKCCKIRRTKSNNTLMLARSDNIATTPGASTFNLDWKIEMESINRFVDDILKEKPMRFTPEHLKEFTQNFSEKLGSGGFGIVYKGRFPNGMQVAVKVLDKTLDRRAEEQFMAEVGTIGRTYHINLVRLYGFCIETTVKALVYEYMENGSLDKFLFDENQRLEWGTLYEIAIGTAKGIRYLHEECQQKIVHYDIKPGNVLLTANFSPKVADFGLAKLCNRENSHVTMTGGRGTPGYAAPELWMPLPVTHKCDVYSFGMLLFEILGRRRNLNFENTESQEWFPKWVWEKFQEGQMEGILTLSGIEKKDGEKAERLCKVALWCIQYQAETRPSMNSVVRMLEGEDEIMPPTNPFSHMIVYNSGPVPQTGSTSSSSGRSDSEVRSAMSGEGARASNAEAPGLRCDASPIEKYNYVNSR